MYDEVYEEFVKRLSNKQLSEVCTENWNDIEDKDKSHLYKLCETLESELELSGEDIVWPDKMYNAVVCEVIDRFVEMVK